MKAIILYIAVIVMGLLVGGLSTLWMLGLFGKGSLASFATINVEGWTSDPSIGAASADPYTRARVARHGLLALAKEEAIYFTRNTDDAGNRLSEDCRYELSGGPQDAFWWSITLYDTDSRLPMNGDGHLSLDATTLGNRHDWSAIISPDEPEAEHWLSSRSAGTFDLTLRLYRPAPDVIEDPQSRLTAPRIQNLGCGGGV